MKVIDEPETEESKEIVTVCQLSVIVFKQMNLKAAKRCAKLVTQIVEPWRRRQDVGKANMENGWPTFDAPASATRLEPMLESHGLDLDVNDDDLWAYFRDSEMHSRSFESWVDILNGENIDEHRNT